MMQVLYGIDLVIRRKISNNQIYMEPILILNLFYIDFQKNGWQYIF
jgi:hypothetical protein